MNFNFTLRLRKRPEREKLAGRPPTGAEEVHRIAAERGCSLSEAKAIAVHDAVSWDITNAETVEDLKSPLHYLMRREHNWP